MTLDFFPQEFFARHNNDEDLSYYEMPRRKIYVDSLAISTLTEFLREILPLGGTYLDLMSSWRSHIPKDIRPARVVGLGLNAQEMAENYQLDEFVVHDLNDNPVLPLKEQQFDAVLCSFSIQYLIQPVEVFCEVNRVLTSSGVFIVTFSDRYFPRKTIAVWRAFNANQRKALVVKYFEVSKNWMGISTRDHFRKRPQQSSDTLYIVWARKSATDRHKNK